MTTDEQLTPVDPNEVRLESLSPIDTHAAAS